MTYREIIRIVERDGWQRVRTTGSHLQFRHPNEPGTVAISAGGKLSSDVPPGALQSVRRPAGLAWEDATMDYVFVIERGADGSFSAYVPDLPGCVACGGTPDETRGLIVGAVGLHIASLREFGDPVPPPTALTGVVHAA